MNQTKVKYWIQASRPRAFPLAAACIGMGAFLANQKVEIDWWIFGLTLLTAMLLQLLSNLANDAGDTINGADHVKREGPARTVQSGVISLKTMKRAVWLVGVLSVFSGVTLIYLSIETTQDIVLFLALGILSILAAVGYTMGKKPYGYMGLGDLSVLIFFGWIGVAGTYYLLSHTWDPAIMLPASSCGLFAVAVLNVNNIRDIDSDREAGKFTLAAQLGHKKSRIYQIILLIIGIGIASYYTYLVDGQWWFLLVVPFLTYNAYHTLARKTAESLDPLVRQMAFASLIFVLLFGIGM
jgi:1,4-dihydroxy-2-naphthoate octaprenyltransferase